MRAQRRTSGPGACRGMAGFARHALVLESPAAKPPSYMSYTSYMSYRDVYKARRRRACGCRGCFPLPGRGAAPHTL